MKKYSKEYKVTFLILNYKTFEDTIILARELIAFKGFGSKYGLVIVDNFSPNESWEELQMAFCNEKDVYIIRSDENGGYARGNNVGLRYMALCPPKYVCIINNDVHFSEETIEHLCEVYETINDVGMMAPIQKHTDGKNLSTSLDFPYFLNDVNSVFPVVYKKSKRWKYESNTNRNNLQLVEIIPGAFIFINYALMQNIGFYDETTFLYCEERILTTKLHRIKRNNYILLDSTYIHQHSLTISSEVSLLKQRRMLFDGKMTYTKFYRTHPRLKMLILKGAYYFSTPLVALKMKLHKLIKKKNRQLKMEGNNEIIDKTANIITIHVGSNFGSNLQTIATCEVLKKNGVESLVVNYKPPRVTWRRFWRHSLHPVTFLHRLYSLPNRLLNNKIYNDYLAKYCKVSKPIYAWDDFTRVCPQADYYITGSDQVWNIKHNEGIDTHYFYEGIKGIKIAYASSIGNEILTEEEKKVFPKFFSEYKAISVREESAKKILNNLGFKATHVIDPTFMLNCNAWKKYATPQKITDNYMLVYLPYNVLDKALIYRSIRKIAMKKHLKVVSFSWGYGKDKYADKTIRYASPGDFLSLMIHAECVVTNSFHGTAFSINLNKQFWVYLPSAFTTRITSIMELCGLGYRKLTDEITNKDIEQEIDYTPVNEILDSERKKTVDFLKKYLS